MRTGGAELEAAPGRPRPGGSAALRSAVESENLNSVCWRQDSAEGGGIRRRRALTEEEEPSAARQIPNVAG
jgi:hypothetical protein